MIRDRAHLLKDLRRWFDDRGYLEVQPPCLSKHAIVDPYIDPIEVGLRLHGDQEQVLRTGYLQTSPELYMKQLLSLGEHHFTVLCQPFARMRWVIYIVLSSRC